MYERTLSDCHVLVAEDEFLLADELHAELIDAGAVVIGPVARVADAIDLIRRAARIDGAILDINLNGETVFPAADLLAQEGVPFVFATGYDQAVIPKRFEHVARCEKPTNMSAAVKAIGRLITPE